MMAEDLQIPIETNLVARILKIRGKRAQKNV
jgi:hypothetical protein